MNVSFGRNVFALPSVGGVSTPQITFGARAQQTQQADSVTFGRANKYGITPAMRAAHTGDIPKLVQILKADPSQIDQGDIKEQGLLAHVMIHKDADALDAVLKAIKVQHKEDPKYVANLINKIDEDGYSLLAWAAELGDKKIIRLLLKEGGKPVIPEAEENSPEKVAAVNGWYDVADELRTAAAMSKLTEADLAEFKLSPAMRAVHQGGKAGNKKLEQILQADPNQILATDAKEQSLLAHLMIRGNAEGMGIVFRVAEETGVAKPSELINKLDEDGYSLLAWAAELGNTDVVKTLVKHGGIASRPDAGLKGLNSPDNIAAINGWDKAASYLRAVAKIQAPLVKALQQQQMQQAAQ